MISFIPRKHHQKHQFFVLVGLISLAGVFLITEMLDSLTSEVYSQIEQAPISNNSNNSTFLGNNLSSAQDQRIRTFHAEGTINTYVSDLLLGNESIGLGLLDRDIPSRIYVLGGDWNLDVINGTIKNFTTNIVMVTFDGNNMHTHSIPNLRNFSAPVPGVYPVSLNSELDLFFSGNVDINTSRGKDMNVTDWEDVPITVTIYNGKTIGILLDPSRIAHFNALPIYGIVTSLEDGNNVDLRTEEIASIFQRAS